MATTNPTPVGAGTQDDAPDPLAPLSPRHRLFVAAYLGVTRFNATEAARLAGFATDGHSLHTVAYRALSRADVQTAIKELLQPSLMGPDEVLAAIKEHVADSDARIRLRALELLARAHGLLADRLRVEGEVNVGQMTDAQLAELRKSLGLP